MRIVVDINHPKDVHFFKNFIWEMEKRGHEIQITASEKEVSYNLLDIYGFQYEKLGNYGRSPVEKLMNLPLLDMKMYQVAKKFNPEIFLGFGSFRAAHVSKVLRKYCIIFDDTEHSKWEHRLYGMFTDEIVTPDCFKKDLGTKQIRFDGYTELAYLHSNRFTPDPAVIAKIGLSRDDSFIIVRFVSWEAIHDTGHYGIRDKIGLVKMLEQYGRVLVTSEGALPPELQPYQIQVSPEKLHDLLYYATLYVGEGATMASEAAVIGTHAIYVNSLNLGYIAEEDEIYHLVSDFSSRFCTDEAVLAEARRLLQDPDLRRDGKRKGEILMQDKIDVTAFMVWFIENHPRSFKEMKEHPEVQYSCASVGGDTS